MARVQRDERVIVVKIRVYIFGNSLERLRFEIENLYVPETALFPASCDGDALSVVESCRSETVQPRGRHANRRVRVFG